LFLVLVLLVPRYEDTFRNQSVKLPAPTALAVAVGRWAEAYWYVLPLFGLLVMLLSWLLRQRARGWQLSWLWFLVVLGIPVLLHLGLWWALHLP
jgi:type II secretory pathway component PulF